MIKGLVILSLMTLGQVDGSSLGAAADGLTDAVVADAASDAGNVAEETVAAEETAVAAEDEKKRDYSAIVGKNGKIDLLFLTDLNGQLADLKCGSEQGSTYANIIGAINSVRGNSLLIGAGNMNGRAPMARFIMDKGAAGAQELASLLALAKFDYILPGAEDFYVPAEQFKNYTAAWKENNLPVAISNLDVAADAAYGKELVAENGYTMLEQNGLKIAVIGLNSDDFIKGANRDNLKGITLKDYNEVAKKAATQAKDEGADFVIAVVKVDDSASAPAHAVGVASAAADVDVVLAAGYQTGKEAFAYRIEMNKAAAPVFAAPANAAGINKISIELKGTAEGWKIARADSNLIATADAAADSTVAAALDANVKAYCEEMTKPIGKGVIDGEMSADQFGNLLAQSARHATKSDVMIVDSNMVNADAFPIKGQISDDTLFAGVSSDGAVYTFKMTGAEITGLCGNAGIKLYGVDCAAGTINGRAANGSDKYHVVTTESLTNGHLGYLAAWADKMKAHTGKNGEKVTLTGLTKAHLNDPMYTAKKDNQVVAIDPDKNFPNLARKVRWAFDGLAQLSVNNTSLSDNVSGYDVAQLTRDEQTSIHSLLQLKADANSAYHMFTAVGTLKYSMTQTKNADGTVSDYVESEDLNSLDLIYRYAGFKAMIPKWYMPLPYVEAVLESEFTKPDDEVRTYHHLELTATLGARWNPWTPLEFKVGLGWQKELLDPTDDVTFGIETGYTLSRFDICKLGPFTLQGESAMQIFISNFSENPTVKGTWTNQLILNIIGPLGLSVRDDFFFYREKNPAAGGVGGIAQTGFANDVVFSLTFTGRLATQAF